MKTKMVTGDCCKINLIAGKAASRDRRNAGYGAKRLFLILTLLVFCSIHSFAVTDVLFLVDTTGSMGGINSIKTAFEGIIAAIEADSCPDTIMFSVADYRNYDDGGNYAAYGVNLVQPFTSNIQNVRDAIDGLTTGDGGDHPESQLKAMVSIANNWTTTAGNLGFKGRQVADRILIWAGDAPGHDDIDNPYYPSLDGTIIALASQSIKVFALNALDQYNGLNELYHNRRQASEITAATGGTLFNQVGSGGIEIEDAIVGAIQCYAFTKDDGLFGQCINPDTTFTYSLCFTNNSDQTLQDTVIIDWLPKNVRYNFILSMNPLIIDENYNSQEHYYRWEIGDIPIGQGACRQLEVTVDSNPAPGGVLNNVAELWGTILVPSLSDPNILVPEMRLLSIATKDTPVCCWQDAPEVLYVDKSVAPGGNGLSWSTAYNNLQHALEYARSAPCGQVNSIYVAQNTYTPGENTYDSFVLPDEISVYGGFPKGGSDFGLRNPRRYQAVLSGKINDTQRNTTVLRMGNNTLLDGFTITESALDGQGIYASDVDFTVANSVVVKNLGYGAFTENCNAVFQWVNFRYNEADGIRHTGEGKMLYLENVWVRQSGQYGIYSLNSVPIVINSVLSESDVLRQGRAGLMMANPPQRPYLQNVTISHNFTEGVALAGTQLPEIYNSIIFHNGGPALVGFSADQAAMYSCIEDANSINFNTSLDPEFLYFDPNNVRISPGSPCRYLSDQSPEFMALYETQLDMDGRPRKSGYAVDAGAYEIACDMDVSSPYDINADGLINLEEFARFSRFFGAHDPNDTALSDPNNPDYEYRTDPNSPGYVTSVQTALWYPDGHQFNFATQGLSAHAIDLADLIFFLEDAPWLWRACWYSEDLQTMSGGEQMQMLAMMETTAEPLVIEQKSVQEQMVDLASAIVFLEQIWLEDPLIQQEIDAQLWQEFMDAVCQNLVELQTGTVQLE